MGAALSLIPAYLFFLSAHGTAVAAFLALLTVIFVRGMVDLTYRKIVPIPSLFGTDDEKLREEDALSRRRIYFWSRKLRLLGWIGAIITVTWLFRGGTWWSNAEYLWHGLKLLTNPQVLMQLVILPIFFLANFLLFFGPMMMMGISQMTGLEPGDADFGVKIDDVRGQAEAKEEIKKVVTLWQSGERFHAAGGKRERGVLFLGPPGVGKTMLAKAIATGYNSPIVLMPGSGFAQTFIGMDVIIVRYMARKARRLAAKWSGSCIIFIDEIDAVGMRRGNLQGGVGGVQRQMPGGGMGGMFGGMGQMGLQSLLVVMDGIDNPPLMKKLITNKTNLWLDASFIVPRSLFGKSLRLAKAKPTSNQIYFVGATNVPLEVLDPALVRPGRMGRHIYFRTPTKRDRLDIFDLYLGKIAHDSALDDDEARSDLAQMTGDYSPAQIEQVCNLALSYAHHDERPFFNRKDLVEAMVTVEAGTALNWGYESKDEEYSVAVHEAGHAVCSILFNENYESTRLSIRKRGATGGHHMAIEREERFSYSRTEVFGNLVRGLGAMAAEYVFFGENTQGVGGDLGQTSALAGTMVGRWGMSPYHWGNSDEFARIGYSLLNPAGPNDVKLGRQKERDEAILVGQAFAEAWNTIRINKEKVDLVAQRLVAEKEIFGRDVDDLLRSLDLEKPDINYLGATERIPTL